MKPGFILKGRYTIERSIRAGGMGAIYLARDGNLANSFCAVKQMLDLGADSEDYLRSKFDSEMRSLVHLQHPGIPRVRDFFVNDQSVFIVMDFIEGLNLEDELATLPGRVLGVHQAAQVAIQVLDVLVYMHGQVPPILHRDIKPANLIREASSKKIRVVDFGLARSHEGQSPQTSVGTLGFCPPEQMYGQAVEASDLYAVGMTLYSLVTGIVPGLRARIELKHSMPTYDEPLAAIIEKATQPDASDRFESARQMQDELEVWLAKRSLAESEQASGTVGAVAERSVGTGCRPGRAETELMPKANSVALSQRHRGPKTSTWGLLALSVCIGVLAVGLLALPRLIPIPSSAGGMKKPPMAGGETPDAGLEGPVFSTRAQGEAQLITLGEDLAILQVGPAGGLTSEQRSQEISKRLNGWYHYRCSGCGSLLLEPSGLAIGKVGDETVLFYAHWHDQSYVVPPFLIATVDTKLAEQLGAGSPKFVAAHWRDLMRDVVGLSRGMQTTHSGLGTELTPVLQRLKVLPPGNTLTNNLKLILSELTSEQTKNLRDAFKSVPRDQKVKVDNFPSHPKFKPLIG